jgi:hypothetical protein
MQKEKTGIKAAKGRSYREIESIAAFWRAKLGYDAISRFDALDFFDNQLGDLQISGPRGMVDIVEHIGHCSQEGLTRYDADHERLEVVLSQETHESLKEDGVRARFTTCHEFGHAVLHVGELIKLAGMPLVGQAAMHRQREYPRYYDSEWQANAFAAALLMPERGIRGLEAKHGFLSDDLIADHFHVSLEAAGYRIIALDKL